MMTIEQIVDETVAYYSADVSRRGLDSSNSCMYITADDKMCAVGRCLVNPNLIENMIEGMDEYGMGVNELDKHLLGLDKFLKPEYQGHPIAFWSKLQILHDFEKYWSENGFTEDGKIAAKHIKHTYSDIKD